MSKIYAILRLAPYFISILGRQWRKKPQAWIHIDPPDGLFKKDEWGQVVPNEVANIQPVYPLEFHSGLWGGEGIVGGFKAPPKQKHQPGKS